MATLTRTVAGLATAGLLTLSHVVFAQTASQADFDACNRMAESTTGVGTVSAGASTGPSGAVGSPIVSGGAASGSQGSSDMNRQRNSSGRISGSPGSPGTNSGTTSTSGAAGAPSASPRMTQTDQQLNGMGAAGHGSAAYQQAYRECMKQRGF
jgi:hypothetical protein